MSVNKYVNGKLLQVSGNADTRLTFDDIISILGYTPVNPNIIGTELATLNSSGKLEDSQKPSYSWSEITGKPSTFTPSSHTHSYAGSSSAGGAATSALTLTTARTLTIGNSGKTFDGSTDVSWSLSEIGAASQSDLDILNSNSSGIKKQLNAGESAYIYIDDGDWCGGIVLISVWKESANLRGIYMAQPGNGNNANSYQTATVTAFKDNSNITVEAAVDAKYSSVKITNNYTSEVFVRAVALCGSQPEWVS